jgi:hypothetical protein
MKTSIIVSSAAALCLMITLAENPANRNNDNENSVPVNLASYLMNDNSANDNSVAYIIAKKATKEVSLPAAIDDLSYLKFDVTDYINEDATAAEATSESKFNYLRFNAADYTSEGDQVSSEGMELPQDNFEYLKFDVNDFIEAGEESTFDYLKFNVADYTSAEDLCSSEEIELPANDFEYLKFDADTYTSTESASEITELPEDDFSYLKFDVNKYINQNLNSASAEELPAACQN